MLSILILTALLILALPADSFAHDCWLQPDSFRIGLESLLLVRLLTGHRLKVLKELAFEKAVTPRWDLYTAAGRTDLLPLSEEGKTPVIELHTDFKGQGLLVMDKDFTDITLSRKQFTSYVDREYHADLPAWREAPPREHERERYARCMKALVWAGEDQDESFHDRPTGQKLEILLQNNPFQRRPGETMEVRVLFEGRAMANKHLTAQKFSVEGEVSRETVKTDENGSAVFTISEPGMWLVRLINLYPCSLVEGTDWESYWSSYCFEIPK